MYLQANWVAKYVSLEMLAHWTGHDLRTLSALFVCSTTSTSTEPWPCPLP